jgi:hypothetical protein
MTKRILNEKEYWNMSYNKRVTNKIRSASGPLIKDHEKGLRLGGIEPELGTFLGLAFLEEISEKGSTRKHTEKRVTRWRI